MDLLCSRGEALGRGSCRALVELRVELCVEFCVELCAKLCAELRAELCAELRTGLRAEPCAEPCAGVQTCRLQTCRRADIHTGVCVGDELID